MSNNLFAPIKIKNVILPNRIVMAPMATHFATYGGFATKRLMDYYEKRAEGGAGLITVEAAAVSREGFGWVNNLAVYDDTFIDGLRNITDAIHKHGVMASLEIYHAGRRTRSNFINQQPVAPSTVSAYNCEMPRELMVVEIEELVYKFGQAARRAKEAGFDAVNIHMAHGYLIQQFLSPLSNKRTDIYGGDAVGRSKFAVDIIKEVRKQVGKDYPIICRLTADEGRSDGLDLKESQKIVLLLVEAGADIIDVTAGGPENPSLTIQTMSMAPGCLTYLSEGIKQVANVPVAVAGRINTPECAEDIIKKNQADLIVMGRALLADPYLPKKAFQGRGDEITPCIACGQGCTHRLAKGLEITCMVNPMVGREGMFEKNSPGKPLKVMVIGGGLAGMYAAGDLAYQGHKVMLFEKGSELGGQGNLAIVPNHKGEIKRLLAYLKRQLQNSGVEVHLNEKVDLEKIKKYAPEVIIEAIGSRPKFIPIEGIETISYSSAWELLKDGNKLLGDTVAIIGGGEVGLETAEYLIQKGSKVYIFEMLPQIGQDMDARERTFLLERLVKTDVEIITQSKVSKIEEGKVYFECGGLEECIEGISAIVMAVGSQSNKLQFLESIDIPVYRIGDCVSPGRMFDAIHQGFMLKSKIQEKYKLEKLIK